MTRTPAGEGDPILTPDQRLRVFVSSSLDELGAERAAARSAIERLRLSPVLFELGARPHPPRSLYLAYLHQSHVFIGIYWQRYGWVAPGMDVSGLEDELREAGDLPRLVYVKQPAPDRDPRLDAMLDRLASPDLSYKRFADPGDLERLVADDLALLLTESFAARRGRAETGRDPAEVQQEQRTRPLPVPASPFIGRAADVDALIDLLTGDGPRLVTLTGPGGVGKTRLALKVAADLAGRFRDGTVFVPLAGVPPEALVGTVASALGLRERGGRRLDTLVAAYLADRESLIVLDNFEHLLPAGPSLGRLLAGAPNLRILVTSRTAIRVSGEQEFVVDPLPVPAPAANEPARVSASEAVQMFVNRVSVVRRGFTVDVGNAAAVADICRRLDGLPLALELVAARANVMSLDELRARLGQVLDMPARATDFEERHRTLRATIDWSFEQLQADEAAALARLAVFVGPFTAEAAEVVLGGRDDVIDILATLVDHSLLRADLSGSRARFAMLELVRDYARSRLGPSDAEDVGARHARHFHGVAVDAESGLRGPEQVRTLAVVDDNLADIEAAMDWLLARGRRDEVAQMAWPLWMYYWTRGLLSSGRRRTRAALDGEGPLSTGARARLLAAHSFLALWQEAYDEVIPQLLEAVELAGAGGDDKAVALAQMALVIAYVAIGDDDRARQAAAVATELCHRQGDEWATAYLQAALCWLNGASAAFDGNEDPYEESLRLARTVDDELCIAMALANLGELRAHQGRVLAASQLLADSLHLCLDLSMVYVGGGVLDVASALLAQAGMNEAAVRVAGAVVSGMKSINAALCPSRLTRLERRIQELRARLGDPRYSAAWSAGKAESFEDAVADALSALAQLGLELHTPDGSDMVDAGRSA